MYGELRFLLSLAWERGYRDYVRPGRLRHCHSAAVGGLRLCHSPLRCCWGIKAPPFPTRLAGGGIEAPPFPTLLAGGGLRLLHSPLSSPEGPLQQLEKIHRAPSGALCFFVNRPSLMQASLQRSVRVQKKPSSVA